MSSNILQEQYFLYAKSIMLSGEFVKSSSKQESQIINQTLANIYANIFETAVDQLELIGASLVPETKFEINCVGEVAKRFFDDDPIFDPKSGAYFQDSLHTKKQMKIYYDSAKLVDLFQNIASELREENTYTCLKNIMNDANDFVENEEILFEEEKQNRKKMNLLKNTLLTEEINNKQQELHLKTEIAFLKDKIEDTKYRNLIETRYLKEWQEARAEQTYYKCNKQESELEKVILSTKNMIDKENRVNTEIEMYLYERSKDVENDIDIWMDKYNKESENKAMQIQIIKDLWEDLQKVHNTLKEEFKIKQDKIDAYLTYKENKRKEEEYLAILSEKATKIQAWWRGLMVRLKLGPFRPVTKTGKKGKNNEKKARKSK